MMVRFLRLGQDPSGWNFSYNLSRKYPFQWFKWLILLLLPCLLVLFTVINVAANGYGMKPIETDDPDGIMKSKAWFQHFFFTLGDDKLKPTCIPMDIAIGGQFMTTNLGLLYTVRKISSFSGSQDTAIPVGAAGYLNQILEDCRVNRVTAEMLKNNQGLAGDLQYWNWRYSTATAEASCNITTAASRYTLTFDVLYNAPALSIDYVVKGDHQAHGSVWWGTRLLNSHFSGLKAIMARTTPREDQGQLSYTQARLSYETNATGGSILDDSLFINPPDYILTVSDGNTDHRDNQDRIGSVYNNHTYARSYPVTEGLFFAKIFYSLVLVDLGERTRDNLLLSERNLKYILDPELNQNYNRLESGFLNNVTDEDDGSIGARDWWRWRGIPAPDKDWNGANSVRMEEAYDAYPDTHNLTTHAAQIRSQYRCTVPVPRSLPGVILLTIFGDFVLLQTAWLILKFFADRYVAKHHPHAMYCEGCAERSPTPPPPPHADEEMVELPHRVDSDGTVPTGHSRNESNSSLRPLSESLRSSSQTSLLPFANDSHSGHAQPPPANGNGNGSQRGQSPPRAGLPSAMVPRFPSDDSIDGPPVTPTALLPRR